MYSVKHATNKSYSTMFKSDIIPLTKNCLSSHPLTLP